MDIAGIPALVHHAAVGVGDLDVVVGDGVVRGSDHQADGGASLEGRRAARIPARCTVDAKSDPSDHNPAVPYENLTPATKKIQPCYLYWERKREREREMDLEMGIMPTGGVGETRCEFEEESLLRGERKARSLEMKRGRLWLASLAQSAG